jgi:hypothetical protein
MILMTEAVFALSVSRFTIREELIKAGIHPLDPLSVLQRCHDWKENGDSYMKDHERTTRTRLHRTLEEGVKEMIRIGQDATLTFPTRMRLMKAIAVEAPLHLHTLQGVDGERQAMKAAKKKKPKKGKQLKVSGTPRSFPDLETALSERKAADEAIIKAKEDAKAAKAATKAKEKAGRAAKAGKASKAGNSAAVEPGAGAPALAPAPTPRARGASKARTAGDAGGASWGTASVPRATPSTAIKARTPRVPQEPPSCSLPVRKAGRLTGHKSSGE